MNFSSPFNLSAASYIPSNQTPILTQRVDCLKQDNYHPAKLGDTAIKIYTDGSVKNRLSSIGIMISCGNKKEIRIASSTFCFEQSHIDAIFKNTAGMSYASIRSLLTEMAAIKYAIYYVDTYLQRGPKLTIITDSLISKCLHDNVSFFHNKFNICRGTAIYNILKRLLSDVGGINIVFQKAHTNDTIKGFDTINSYGNYIADHLAKLRYPANMTEEDILEFEYILSDFEILDDLIPPR